MTNRELNELLVRSFPETEKDFSEYTSWQDGMETGRFLTYEDLLLPLMRRALSEGDENVLRRGAALIEQPISLDDDYAANLACVGLIEGLKSEDNPSARDYLGPRSKQEFDSLPY